MNENILLVEDEEAMRMVLSDRLQRAGYVVDSAADGKLGSTKATSRPFDLIILDVMLPERDGFAICRDVRGAGLETPILLLTARTETVDKILGLKLGADDYLTKPFDMSELTARVEALLRRTPHRSRKNIYVLGPISIDTSAMEITRQGVPIPLSAREFQLLCYFAEHPGVALSRSEILRDVWGYEVATFTRTVDVHVAGLRQKLEKDPRNPELIHTVPGIGYKFVV